MTPDAAHEVSPPPLFAVTPEPSGEELAAITAVVLGLMQESSDRVAPVAPCSAWRAAALAEGIAAGGRMVAWRRGGGVARS